MTMFVGTLLVEAIAFTSATATSLKSRARELAVLRAEASPVVKINTLL